MRYMDKSRFWACDFWALLVILTCSCLLRTASGDPRTDVAGQFSDNSLSTSDANHEKNLARDQRIDIVQGVAEGLSYLHKESKTRNIHRDRKASNIPLDDKFNSIPDSDHSIPERTFRRQTLARCGSPSLNGRSLREYLMEKAKAEVDAYSFGVQVFEIAIVTQKRCMMAWEQLWLEVWRRYNSYTLDVIVNNKIRQENRKECISHVIYIGLSCTLKNPIDRPTMAQVVELLSGRQCGGVYSKRSAAF